MPDMYPVETLHEDEDDGTMPANVEQLADEVVGHRIVSAEKRSIQRSYYHDPALVITLDNGIRVALADDSNCCAHTSLESFLLHPDRVDHIITGVGTTGEYTRWHIYADMGDVLELEVAWSCGNPFYYGYGFNILVLPLEDDNA